MVERTREDVVKVTEADRSVLSVDPAATEEPEGPWRLVEPGLEATQMDAARGAVAIDAVLDAWAARDREWLLTTERDLQDVLALNFVDEKEAPASIGRIESVLEVVRGALRRLAAEDATKAIEPQSRAHQMILALADKGGRGNRDLARVIGVDESEISRTGRKLEALALAAKRRMGRVNWWELTPRGRQALEALSVDQRASMAESARDLDILKVVRSLFAEMAISPGQLSGLSSPDLAKRFASDLRVSESRAQDGVNLLANSPLLERRPRKGLSLRQDQPCAIGVSVNADEIVGVLVDASAELLSEPIARGVEDRSVEGIVRSVAELAKDLVQRHGSIEPLGLGVELPGHVDGWRGEVRLSHEFGGKPWQDVDLGHLLREATGYSAIAVENDANALALYERYFGIGQTCRDFSTLLVTDRGIGAGIVLDGMLLRGEEAAAGEIGHIPIGTGEVTCQCGRNGCFEGQVLSLIDAAGKAPNARDAKRFATEAGDLLGRGIAVLLNILGSNHVIIVGCGPVFAQGSSASKAFRGAARRAVEECGFSSAALVDPGWRFGSREHQARGAAAALIGRYRPSEHAEPETARELLSALQRWGTPAIASR